MLVATLVAFGLPGTPELMVLLVLGLLIFGRRLPEVGRTVGKTVSQLRRGLDDFKRQIDTDEDLREARSTVRDIRREIEAPRVLADPRRIFDHTGETGAGEPETDDRERESGAAPPEPEEHPGAEAGGPEDR